MTKHYTKYILDYPQKGEFYLSGLRILEAKENLSTKHFIMIEVANLEDI